jgi:hypothetical protein
MSNDDWFDEYSEQARKTLHYFFALARIRERLNCRTGDQLYDIRRIVDAALAKPAASAMSSHHHNTPEN